MNDIGFKKEITTGSFLNPFDGFRNKEVVIEERYDKTTGVASRILPFRVRPAQKPDVSAYLAKSPESLCPFCRDLFEKTTPKFAADIIQDGKFRRGEASLFPNAFPYDQSSMVAIFSPRHFVPIDQITPDFMRDGFAVCRNYFTRMSDLKKELRYCSINWNYMPPSGGGLIHPHLQTIAGAGPTNFMQRLIAGARNYAAEHGGNLWRDLIDHEKESGERFIADTGPLCWISAFSPRGMAGEIDFFFKERTSLFDIGDADFEEMLAGLSKVFTYLSAVNFISFNLTLYAAVHEEKDLWVQGKLVPRFEINALGTSDVNYFEKLHNEIICLTVPEQMCTELQPYFI